MDKENQVIPEDVDKLLETLYSPEDLEKIRWGIEQVLNDEEMKGAINEKIHKV